MKRNILKYLCMATMAVLSLAACGGGDDDTPDDPVVNPGGGTGGGTTTGKTYNHTHTLQGRNALERLTLTDLNTQITSMTGNDSWLEVRTVAYTSGPPEIQLKATDNTTGQQRTTTVTLTAASGDKVVLAVTQLAATGTDTPGTSGDEGGYDHTTNEYSDQSAFGRTAID